MFRVCKSKRFDVSNLHQMPAKTEGFVFWCNQQALVFGSDRNPLASFRPIVSIMRSDLVRPIVLPCTRTLNTSHPEKFFKLESEHILMKTSQHQADPGFVYYRYETVPTSSLQKKMGILSQDTRVALFHWLIHRY